MQLIKNIKDIIRPFPNAVITIGNFDGVHIGHQALFHASIEKAEEINGTSIALTFDPHPMRVIKKNNHPPLITLIEQKIELIERSGIDVLICQPFTRDFASVSATHFIKKILVQTIGMKAIVVGNDYTFGNNREGNIKLLDQFSGKYGYTIEVVDWINRDKNAPLRISSTGIRNLVIDGHVAHAKQLLGRHYQIKGTVGKGRDRGGKLLGFPTANVSLMDELCPKTGVYAVTVENQKKLYMGVANIGYSPTFDDNIFTVEVHLLDFDGNIYDQEIRINFIDRIRDEIKFSGIDALSAQIKKDIQNARLTLASFFNN